MTRHLGWALTLACALVYSLSATAFAGRLSLSSQTVRATFARVNFSGGLGTIECQLTVEGSFHTRTLAKVEGLLFGYITAATVGTCARGSATVLRETMPWHQVFGSFAGTLPNITRITAHIRGARFRLREPTFGIQCVALLDDILLISNEALGVLTSAELAGTAEQDCGIPATISGRSNSFTVLGAATRITVTLI